MHGLDFVFILNSIIEITYIRCKTNKIPDENPDPSMYLKKAILPLCESHSEQPAAKAISLVLRPNSWTKSKQRNT
jgi:hypothetical protein